MPTYTAPTTRTTGELISAAIFNTDLVENIKYFKDAPAFAANVTVGGTLTVSGFGTSSFSAGGTGEQGLKVRNTTAGAGNYALVGVGNDTTTDHTTLVSFSSTYTTSGPNVANGSKVYAGNAGGLSIAAQHASGAIRFYSGGTTERARFTSGGIFALGTDLAFTDGTAISLTGNVSTTNIIAMKATTNGTGGTFVVFENAAGSVTGKIYQDTTSTTAYVTSSDARLKNDLGLASDLSALRALRIHDYAWKDSGVVDRNVFAQEAFQISPRGVKVGKDDYNAEGALIDPWMFDRLVYVPDLIVGWQQHDATIQQLAARIAALEGRQ